MMRVSAAVAWATRELGSAAEARTLTAQVLGAEPSRLALAGPLSDADLARLTELIRRRREGIPVQHLTGRAFFRTIEVAVGPGVFIPRPETEVLVSWALERLAEFARPRPLVVELCAGSGAISKALSVEFPNADYRAVELSEEAWPYLSANLAGSGVTVALGDMADAFGDLDRSVDLIVANPPYVPDRDRDALPVEVGHDPELALFAGPDGLAALRVVARVARRLLHPGGWVGAEHDDSHELSAPALFADGFIEVADHRDLTGRPRFVVARRGSGGLAGCSA